MEDLGQPSSYLAIGRGTLVLSSDGERLGKVVRVLCDPDADVFDGIVFDTTAGPGGHRFVDGPEVGDIYERGVVLKIDATVAMGLPAPSENPGSLSVDPADLVGARGGFLRRTWNAITGRR